MRTKPLVEFFSTGSTLLDLALGGGWARGRVFNIVGDRSSGKTLLAIEAFANFSQIKGARMRYAEAESAFDDEYAHELGFPTSVTRPEEPILTVEQFYEDLVAFTKEKGESLYILDSLDALSDASELASKITDATYGTGKAKQMSKLFRMIVKHLNTVNCTLGIISQVRDTVSSYGAPETRGGGRALDFYASQILWLTETGKHVRTVREQDRPVGVYVTGKVKKLKVGIPFRAVDFEILFGYGIDDEASLIEFLKQVKEYTAKEATDLLATIAKARKDGNVEYLVKLQDDLIAKVTKIWGEIESRLKPEVRKYR